MQRAYLITTSLRNNIAYYLGMGDSRAAQHVNAGKSIFSDDHGGIMGNGMKISYMISHPLYSIWDLIVNGGYGRW